MRNHIEEGWKKQETRWKKLKWHLYQLIESIWKQEKLSQKGTCDK